MEIHIQKNDNVYVDITQPQNKAGRGCEIYSSVAHTDPDKFDETILADNMTFFSLS